MFVYTLDGKDYVTAIADRRELPQHAVGVIVATADNGDLVDADFFDENDNWLSLDEVPLAALQIAVNAAITHGQRTVI